MGVKANAHRRRLLQTFGSTRRCTLLNRSFWQLHYRSSLLRRWFIGSSSIRRGSSGSIPFRVLFITGKETKSKNFALVKKRKRIKDKYLSQQDSRVQSVKNFNFRRIGSRGLPDRSFGSRGAQRKKLFDMFPLLIKARFFRMCRRR
jgi:hypothetical protein